MSTQVWAIGAGKGGVGKTFICSSLGITLSKLNHSVLLVDFDFSGANLHTTLGQSLSERNLRRYFAGEMKLSEITQTTRIPRLSYVQGFWDQWSPVDVQTEQVQKLVEHCRSLNYDYVLFDLGSGSHPAYLELFKQSDEKFLITHSEPTSIEKTYRFLESFICYRMKDYSTKESFERLQHNLRMYRSKHPKGCFSFRNYLAEACGFDVDFFEQFNEKPVRLIINCARSRQDQELGHSMKSVSNKYFDIALEYTGSLDYDNAVWQSVKTREPVLIEKPFTPLAGQFLTICKLLTTPNFNANILREVI